MSARGGPAAFTKGFVGAAPPAGHPQEVARRRSRKASSERPRQQATRKRWPYYTRRLPRSQERPYIVGPPLAGGLPGRGGPERGSVFSGLSDSPPSGDQQSSKGQDEEYQAVDGSAPCTAGVQNAEHLHKGWREYGARGRCRLMRACLRRWGRWLLCRLRVLSRTGRCVRRQSRLLRTGRRRRRRGHAPARRRASGSVGRAVGGAACSTGMEGDGRKHEEQAQHRDQRTHSPQGAWQDVAAQLALTLRASLPVLSLASPFFYLNGHRYRRDRFLYGSGCTQHFWRQDERTRQGWLRQGMQQRDRVSQIVEQRLALLAGAQVGLALCLLL